MCHDDRPRSPTYDILIGLLSEDEIVSVNTGNVATSRADSDEYLDLEQLEQGVRRGPGPPRPICRVLARSAVREATWQNILSWLRATNPKTLRRAGRASRSTRLGQARLARAGGARSGP